MKNYRGNKWFVVLGLGFILMGASQVYAYTADAGFSKTVMDAPEKFGGLEEILRAPEFPAPQNSPMILSGNNTYLTRDFFKISDDPLIRQIRRKKGYHGVDAFLEARARRYFPTRARVVPIREKYENISYFDGIYNLDEILNHIRQTFEDRGIWNYRVVRVRQEERPRYYTIEPPPFYRDVYIAVVVGLTPSGKKFNAVLKLHRQEIWGKYILTEGGTYPRFSVTEDGLIWRPVFYVVSALDSFWVSDVRGRQVDLVQKAKDKLFSLFGHAVFGMNVLAWKLDGDELVLNLSTNSPFFGYAKLRPIYGSIHIENIRVSISSGRVFIPKNILRAIHEAKRLFSDQGAWIQITGFSPYDYAPFVIRPMTFKGNVYSSDSISNWQQGYIVEVYGKNFFGKEFKATLSMREAGYVPFHYYDVLDNVWRDPIFRTMNYTEPVMESRLGWYGGRRGGSFISTLDSFLVSSAWGHFDTDLIWEAKSRMSDLLGIDLWDTGWHKYANYYDSYEFHQVTSWRLEGNMLILDLQIDDMHFSGIRVGLDLSRSGKAIFYDEIGNALQAGRRSLKEKGLDTYGYFFHASDDGLGNVVLTARINSLELCFDYKNGKIELKSVWESGLSNPYDLLDNLRSRVQEEGAENPIFYDFSIEEGEDGKVYFSAFFKFGGIIFKTRIDLQTHEVVMEKVDSEVPDEFYTQAGKVNSTVVLEILEKNTLKEQGPKDPRMSVARPRELSKALDEQNAV